MYGATLAGGVLNAGTIFRLTPGGNLTTLHTFDVIHACPNALSPGVDGNLYGTTADLTFYPDLCAGAVGSGFGAMFRITPQGDYSLLAELKGDGISPAFPSGPLLAASDGNFYGVSAIGGDSFLAVGTVFQLTPAGQVSWSSLAGGSSGAIPCCDLLQSHGGDLLGVTQGFLDIEFGPEDAVVFATGLGLARPRPAITNFLPASGKAGTLVKIRGDHFLFTARVLFNGGVIAPFLVTSTNFIFAVVPAGASTGPVSIINPGGTTVSTNNFVVLP